MKMGRCPTCYSHIHLEQIVQDEAASEMIKLLIAQPQPLQHALVQYLGLFRPAKSDLSHARALRLLQEVTEINDPALLYALTATVDQLRTRTNNKPIKNHNYLLRVIETTEVTERGKVVSRRQVSDKNTDYIERHSDTSWSNKFFSSFRDD